MHTNILPKVSIHVELHDVEDRVTATATVEGLSEPFTAEASAAHGRGDAAPLEIAPDLAVARVLNRLQHGIIESIHERIDRSGDDI